MAVLQLQVLQENKITLLNIKVISCGHQQDQESWSSTTIDNIGIALLLLKSRFNWHITVATATMVADVPGENFRIYLICCG